MKFGDRVRDGLTGFEGIVVAFAQYMTGCNQALVKPEKLKKDGSMVEAEWFDTQRLGLVQINAFSLDNGVTPGGPQHW